MTNWRLWCLCPVKGTRDNDNNSALQRSVMKRDDKLYSMGENERKSRRTADVAKRKVVAKRGNNYRNATVVLFVIIVLRKSVTRPRLIVRYELYRAFLPGEEMKYGAARLVRITRNCTSFAEAGELLRSHNRPFNPSSPRCS